MNILDTQLRKFVGARCAGAQVWTLAGIFLLTGGRVVSAQPAAVADLAVTPRNQIVIITALTNDTDAATNQMGILQVTKPAHGTVTINSNAAVLTPELSNLFQFAAIQLSNSVKQVHYTNLYPRSTLANGMWTNSAVNDWISGFFPGTMWYVYEQTGDTNCLNWAREWTGDIATEDVVTNTDDIGFMINTSFGNGFRITGDTNYRTVLLTGASSLAMRTIRSCAASLTTACSRPPLSR